jgi:hypothetical protein
LASKGGSAKVKQQIPQFSHGLFEGVFISHLDEGYTINLTSNWPLRSGVVIRRLLQWRCSATLNGHVLKGCLFSTNLCVPFVQLKRKNEGHSCQAYTFHEGEHS